LTAWSEWRMVRIFFSEHTQCTKKWGAPNFRQDLPPIRCRYHIMCRRWDTLFFLFNVQLLWIRCTLLSGSDFFVGLRIKDEIFNINNRVHKCELLRLKTGGGTLPHIQIYWYRHTWSVVLRWLGDSVVRAGIGPEPLHFQISTGCKTIIVPND